MNSNSATGQHWIHRVGVYQLVAVASLCGLAIWMVSSGIDLLWLMYPGLSVIAVSTVDAVVAICIGVLVLKLMLAHRARYRKVVQQLAIIAEMNHQIRNALENIQLTAYVTHDQQLISELHISVQRIDWALREVLPKAAEEHDDEQDS